MQGEPRVIEFLIKALRHTPALASPEEGLEILEALRDAGPPAAPEEGDDAQGRGARQRAPEPGLPGMERAP